MDPVPHAATGRTLPGFLVLSLPLLLVAIASAHAQSIAAPDAIAYCADLKRVLMAALTKDRFATIAGKERDGDFASTTAPLWGWQDCSVYGSRTYTCDSKDLRSTQEAADGQAAIVREIKACLGDAWAEDIDRSSATYVVLRSSGAPVSMTIATNANGTNGHVVRLTVFLRTGG